MEIVMLFLGVFVFLALRAVIGKDRLTKLGSVKAEAGKAVMTSFAFAALVLVVIVAIAPLGG